MKCLHLGLPNQAFHYLTVLPTFEDVLKSHLLVQHNTKQESGDQQPSIAETFIAELVAPQLEHLWH